MVVWTYRILWILIVCGLIQQLTTRTAALQTWEFTAMFICLVVEPTPLKNDGVRQLGWLFVPIYGKITNVPNHQPVMLVAFNFSSLTSAEVMINLWIWLCPRMEKAWGQVTPTSPQATFLCHLNGEMMMNNGFCMVKTLWCWGNLHDSTMDAPPQIHMKPHPPCHYSTATCA